MLHGQAGSAGFTLAKRVRPDAEPVMWRGVHVGSHTPGSAPQTMQGRSLPVIAVSSRLSLLIAAGRAEELGPPSPPPRQATEIHSVRHGAPRHAIGGAWHLNSTSAQAPIAFPSIPCRCSQAAETQTPDISTVRAGHASIAPLPNHAIQHGGPTTCAQLALQRPDKCAPPGLVID
jgi:hypothetical protein